MCQLNYSFFSFVYTDSLVPPDRGSLNSPARFCIVDVFRGAAGSSATTLAGIVCSGSLQVSDRIVLQPSGQTASIKSITIDGQPSQVAFGGDQAQIVLNQSIDPAMMSPGNIMAELGCPAPITSRFRARIVVFDVRVPLTQGFPVMLHIHNAEEPASIAKLLAEVSKTTGEVKKQKIKYAFSCYLHYYSPTTFDFLFADVYLGTAVAWLRLKLANQL